MFAWLIVKCMLYLLLNSFLSGENCHKCKLYFLTAGWAIHSMRSFVKYLCILNLGLFIFIVSGIRKVRDDKMYLELSPVSTGTWRKFRSQVDTLGNSHQLMKANQMRRFVQDFNMRSELNPYLKAENVGGNNDKVRNKHIIATVKTELAVYLVLSKPNQNKTKNPNKQTTLPNHPPMTLYNTQYH